MCEHNRNAAVKCGAAHSACIFIQLSYLSEQIIRGDKLKRWGNNGSCWEAAEMIHAYIPEKHQELGKQKSTLQSIAIPNELRLMMVMMGIIMMRKMLWIQFEWWKVSTSNNATHFLLSSGIVLCRFPNRKLRVCMMTWCAAVSCSESLFHNENGLRTLETQCDLCGKCSWTEHGPWHLVQEASKVMLLIPLVGNNHGETHRVFPLIYYTEKGWL